MRAAAAANPKGEAYRKKAADAVAKLGDLTAGRWAASPWWEGLPKEGARVPKLATPCPVLQW